MTPNQLRKTLALALADRAPKANAQMKAAGQLATFLDSLTGQTLQSMREAQGEIGSQAQTGQPPYNTPATLVQMLNFTFKAAEDTAIAQAIEQIDSLQQHSDLPEVSARVALMKPIEEMSPEEARASLLKLREVWRDKKERNERLRKAEQEEKAKRTVE